MYRPLHRPLAAAALLLLLAAPAAATTFVGLDDGALADRAPLIVEARVIGLSPAPGMRPAIDYRLAVEASFKGGPAAGELVLRLPGGVRADGVGLRLLGVPALAAGERTLLFLRPQADGTYGLVDLVLGAFVIRGEGDAALAVRDLRPARRLVRGPRPRDGSRHLRRFGAWLRDRAAGIERPADYFVATPPPAADKYALFVSSTLPPPLGCGGGGGRTIRWTAFDDGGAVVWRRHDGGQDGLADGGAGAFAAALAAWSTAGTPVRLEDGGTTAATAGFERPDGVNALLPGDPNDELPGRFEGGGLLALGGVWFDCDELASWGGVEHHVAFESDVVVQDGVEDFLLASADPQAAAAELYGHELGHTLGIDHSDDPEALMYGAIHDDGRGAGLQRDDRDALRLLYGAAGAVEPPGEPPPAPAEVAAVLVEETAVELTWSHPRPADGVRIERRLEQGGFELVATVGGVERFEDSGLLPGVTYGYRLQAISPAGASPYSQEVEVATGGSLLPARPSNLRVAPTSPTSVFLSWQDNASDELFQRIEMRLDAPGDPWVALPAIAADARSASIGGLEPATGYRFRVRAAGLLGESPPSNVFAAATFAEDAGCTAAEDVLCLLGGRFAARVRWRNPRDGTSGTGSMIPSTDNTGEVWFFRPANVELIVKMIDGSRTNGYAWVFFGGLSSLEYWLTITDTVTGEVREYHNPAGTVCGQSDTLAFDFSAGGVAPPEPPPASPPERLPPAMVPPAKDGGCPADGLSLCLLGGRFRAQVGWRNQHDGGSEGLGRAVVTSDNAGSFWFFNPSNSELVIKILDGRRVNDHFWVFTGALSNVEYWLTVSDLETGVDRVYYNPPGEICGRADLTAFGDVVEPPGGPGGPDDPLPP
ncbi:MAG: hypothetical protein D6696_11590 [Acidobacteria bacterium]|nr:MAG: hypothetical protein D6696_11590 [Acidobacteriota bacterium]